MIAMSADIRPLYFLAEAGAVFVRIARGEKRPLGNGWQHRGTDNVELVEAWIRSGCGVGLLLGRESGLVDVEHDDAEGEAIARELGIDSIPCPTWRSARGLHRLFRWSDCLPDSAVAKIGALEVRIGGRAAQSVLPPSRHPTGLSYRWETSPLEASVPEIPASILESLF